MEHLDLETVLTRMGSQYRRMEPSINYFDGVKVKIEAKINRRNFYKVLGIAFTAIFALIGIVSHNSVNFKDFGNGFSAMIYISYAFILMCFITIAVINSQKFFTKVLGEFSLTTLKKINDHRCYFNHEEQEDKEKENFLNQPSL